MTRFERKFVFPRAFRLLQSKEFQTIFRRPVVVNDRLFRVYARGGTGHSRLGLAISRKAAPRAVDRNRIKRQIREAFRHHRQYLQAAGGLELVVLAKAEAKTVSGCQLYAAIIALFDRAIERARPISEA